jgi:hypothetical protein
MAKAKERARQDFLAQRQSGGFSDRRFANGGGEFTHPTLA